MFSLIAAIGKNRELGKDGELVFHIPEDMKYFRETTMGHKVLMGRRTWESLPGKLPNRENIVISRDLSQTIRGSRPDSPYFVPRPKGRSSRVSGAIARRSSAIPSNSLTLNSSTNDNPAKSAQCDEAGKNVDFAMSENSPILNSSSKSSPDLVISGLKDFAKENKDSEEEIFVIGGGMVYWEMMKYAKRLYLTEVEAEAEADTFFPEFNKDEWNRTVIREGEDDGIKYAFVLYERK